MSFGEYRHDFGPLDNEIAAWKQRQARARTVRNVKLVLLVIVGVAFMITVGHI